jgi:hypothetical protein
MEFRIADTFSDSLARLTGDEQKGVKTTAFDLQLNPANPGMMMFDHDAFVVFWSSGGWMIVSGWSVLAYCCA